MNDLETLINNGFTRLAELVKSNNKATKENASLLPFKIGANWYTTGLLYDYMYPVSLGASTAVLSNKRLYLSPMRILEDTTIKRLAITCSVAQSGSSAIMGVYSSNPDNTINQLLASGTVDLSSTGAKTVAVNIPLIKGQVVYLAYLSAATGTVATTSTINTTTGGKAFAGLQTASSIPATGFYKDGLTDLPATLTQSDLKNLEGGTIARTTFGV